MEGKNKKNYTCWIVIAVTILIIISITYIKFNPTTNQEKIFKNVEYEKIEILDQSGSVKKQSANTKLFANIMIQNAKKTNKQSVNDTPTNITEYKKVILKDKKGGTITIYVYKKNGNYYVEKPYSGIWKLNDGKNVYEELFIRRIQDYRLE